MSICDDAQSACVLVWPSDGSITTPWPLVAMVMANYYTLRQLSHSNNIKSMENGVWCAVNFIKDCCYALTTLSANEKMYIY